MKKIYPIMLGVATLLIASALLGREVGKFSIKGHYDNGPGFTDRAAREVGIIQEEVCYFQDHHDSGQYV
jgi:hypothetical protein